MNIDCKTRNQNFYRFKRPYYKESGLVRVEKQLQMPCTFNFMPKLVGNPEYS